MAENAASRVRRICLALPETTEKQAWGEPTFRVGQRIFAMLSSIDGATSVWCKSDDELRDALIGSDPEHFFSPPYVGHKGWIGIRLDASANWESVANLIEESYLMIAERSRHRSGASRY
ncbi:MAG: MmcQ/YjbR family DNA-binding protein [Thermomicrobiales bacterium]